MGPFEAWKRVFNPSVEPFKAIRLARYITPIPFCENCVYAVRVRNIWSFEFGSIFGVEVRGHITVTAMIMYALVGVEQRTPLEHAILAFSIVATLVIHEIGHALARRLCGVTTSAITLYPFGGVASLTTLPKPGVEALIAMGGPLANVVVAGALLPFCDVQALMRAQTLWMPWTAQLLAGNFLLAAFNLIPALPLDGGRVLRSLLTLCGVRHTTLIVSKLSQLLCFGCALVAFWFDQPALFAGAFIIFFGAFQEHMRSESRAGAVGLVAADAMIPRARLENLPHGATVSGALKVALTSLHPLYPVQNANDLIGVVFRDDILQHAATEPDAYISAITTKSLQTIKADAPLSLALSLFEGTGAPVMIVREGSDFVGLLLPDRVSEFILMRGLQNDRTNGDDVPWSIRM